MRLNKSLIFNLTAILIAATQVASEAAIAKETCPISSAGQAQRIKRSTKSFWKGMSDDASKYIQELEESTQQMFLANHNWTVVMYYAPWCGYSIRARATFLSRANRYREYATFAAMDADNFRNDCVTKYPTFIAFKNGKYVTELTNFMSWSEDDFEKVVKQLPHAHYEPYCQWAVDKKESSEEPLGLPTSTTSTNATTSSTPTTTTTPPTRPAPTSTLTTTTPPTGTAGVRRNSQSFWKEKSTCVKKHLHELEESTQDRFLAERDLTVVMYYAPWSEASVNARSEFLSRASRYKSNATFAAMNAESFQNACVREFPTFVAFVKGEYVATLHNFMSWSEDEFKKVIKQMMDVLQVRHGVDSVGSYKLVKKYVPDCQWTQIRSIKDLSEFSSGEYSGTTIIPTTSIRSTTLTRTITPRIRI